jgi:D-inositol-3-phosphate glycosyltransferase
LSYLIRDGETGFLVPEGDERQFAAKISLLLHDTQLRNAMGERGIAEAQEYSWSNIAERMIDMYDDLLKQKKPSA